MKLASPVLLTCNPSSELCNRDGKMHGCLTSPRGQPSGVKDVIGRLKNYFHFGCRPADLSTCL